MNEIKIVGNDTACVSLVLQFWMKVKNGLTYFIRKSIFHEFLYWFVISISREETCHQITVYVWFRLRNTSPRSAEIADKWTNKWMNEWMKEWMDESNTKTTKKWNKFDVSSNKLNIVYSYDELNDLSKVMSYEMTQLCVPFRSVQFMHHLTLLFIWYLYSMHLNVLGTCWVCIFFPIHLMQHALNEIKRRKKQRKKQTHGSSFTCYSTLF